MVKAIQQLKSGLIVRHAMLGFRNGVTGSIRQQVHDGDTINVGALGNFGVRKARLEGKGIFNPDDLLKVEPFEVRFLADQQRPTRWVIDLSKNSDILVDAQKYHIIKNPEDRLFVPEEYVALFVEKGWNKKSGKWPP